MRYIIGVVWILSFLWVFGNASQGASSDSIEPMYANAAGVDLMSDAPWVVKYGDIPLHFRFSLSYALLSFFVLPFYIYF